MTEMAQTLEGFDANRSRQRERDLRRLARDLARQQIAEFLGPLLLEKAPHWLTAQQASAYEAEIRRLCGRAIGK
jgi:hypothetical protein